MGTPLENASARLTTALSNAKSAADEIAALAVPGTPPPPVPVPTPPPPPPPPPGPPPTGAANVTDLGIIPSALLGNGRRVRVYLPPGYNAGTQRYPVLYLHDGQSIFGATNAFYMDKRITPLFLAGTHKPVIVVTVEGKVDTQANMARTAEYRIVAPHKGQLYAKMMAEEMVPFIDGKFRTLANPANRAIGGVSLGAVQAWYSGMKYPQVFGLVCSQSGVFRPQDGAYNHVADVQAIPGKLPFRAYWDRGTQDGESSHQVNDQAMVTALKAKGMIEGVDFKYQLVQGAKHEWSAWSTRIPDFMKFLFS